jgi:hypothetical protein
MLVSTLFTLFGLGALCWILFNLAVYALPFAIGLTSGMYLYETGQGVFLSIIAGLFIGGFIAALGEFAFDRIRSVPHQTRHWPDLRGPRRDRRVSCGKGSCRIRQRGRSTIILLSWLGALVVGGTAWARVSGWSEVNAMSDPHPHRSFDEH